MLIFSGVSFRLNSSVIRRPEASSCHRAVTPVPGACNQNPFTPSTTIAGVCRARSKSTTSASVFTVQASCCHEQLARPVTSVKVRSTTKVISERQNPSNSHDLCTVQDVHHFRSQLNRTEENKVLNDRSCRIPDGGGAVSYTHLTLPTRRTV